MAGSQDNHPPVLVYPDDYEFAVIGHADDQFSVYRSTASGIAKADIIRRLRDIALHIEASDAQ
jgi:hypothetical protein